MALTLGEIRKMSKEEKIAKLREIRPDTVIVALLAFLPSTFRSDREKLHTKILELREQERYQELLKAFEPVPAPSFAYSPLLERVLKRLQEARLLAARNPDFTVFQISDEARKTVDHGILSKFEKDQQIKLKEIAEKLAIELKE